MQIYPKTKRKIHIHINKIDFSETKRGSRIVWKQQMGSVSREDAIGLAGMLRRPHNAGTTNLFLHLTRGGVYSHENERTSRKRRRPVKGSGSCKDTSRRGSTRTEKKERARVREEETRARERGGQNATGQHLPGATISNTCRLVVACSRTPGNRVVE